jgi:ppGpp synthetase/RelA/SpoT-type nucleotidyltranferase
MKTNTTKWQWYTTVYLILVTNFASGYILPDRGVVGIFRKGNNQDGKENKCIVVNNTKHNLYLPCWILRHEGRDLVKDQEEINHLEFKMLELGLSPMDIRDIATIISKVTQRDNTLLSGMIEFMHLMLDSEGESIDRNPYVTKEILMASAIHYGDCVFARRDGVYEIVRDAIMNTQGKNSLLTPTPFLNTRTEIHDKSLILEDYVNQNALSDADVVKKNCVTYNQVEKSVSIDDDVMAIVEAAAKLKRAEIMVYTIIGDRSCSKKEASKIRGMLLSEMDDWRALVIRIVACQFRLEGLLKADRLSISESERTPEVMRIANDAIRVYAPLSQRMGMQRLKAKLEESAFKVLYRRQYQAATALYRQNSFTLNELCQYLENHIAHLLLSDQRLMSQLEDLKISSRVKEPYSLWKKLVRKRFFRSYKPDFSSESDKQSSSNSELSLFDINDAVALRVILKAKRNHPQESDESLTYREKLLCYYIQQLLFSQWDTKFSAKDYIQYPKENGYQSLHFNSFILNQGRKWPFEVQIRSEEMHKIAEYGIAAHWDYKLGKNKILGALPPSREIKKGDTPNRNLNALSIVRPSVQKSYIEALVRDQHNLVKDQVFVLFANTGHRGLQGQILSLPASSTIQDAIHELNSIQQSKSKQGAPSTVLMNGKPANLNDKISNADVLWIDQES